MTVGRSTSVARSSVCGWLSSRISKSSLVRPVTNLPPLSRTTASISTQRTEARNVGVSVLWDAEGGGVDGCCARGALVSHISHATMATPHADWRLMLIGELEMPAGGTD